MRRLSAICVRVLIILAFAGCAVPQQPRRVGVEAPVSIDTQRKAQDGVRTPAAKTYKRKVAIGRFTNETIYGKGLLRDADLDPLGKQASDILAADLVRSQRFLVFERPDISKLLREQEISGSGSLVGVDALILGSVSEFGRTTEGTTGFLSSTKLQKVKAKVNIRLVDPKTGLAFFSTTGAGEATSESGAIAGFGSKAEFDATLNDQAIRAAIADLMDSMINHLEERAWRTSVLSIEGDKILIGGGALQGLQIGDQLAVVQQGKPVLNRQTGLLMDLPGKEIARLQLLSFFGKSETDQGSVCKVVSGSLAGVSLDSVWVSEIQEAK
jgi:curli biogenesis system outer membrane secretion channel CsgG